MDGKARLGTGQRDGASAPCRSFGGRNGAARVRGWRSRPSFRSWRRLANGAHRRGAADEKGIRRRRSRRLPTEGFPGIRRRLRWTSGARTEGEQGQTIAGKPAALLACCVTLARSAYRRPRPAEQPRCVPDAPSFSKCLHRRGRPYMQHRRSAISVVRICPRVRIEPAMRRLRRRVSWRHEAANKDRRETRGRGPRCRRVRWRRLLRKSPDCAATRPPR